MTNALDESSATTSRRAPSDGHDPLTSTVLLKGQLIVEGVKFSWWVVHGERALVTVSHSRFGTRTGPLEESPQSAARHLARDMLMAAK